MKVHRTQIIETDDLKIGDKILIELAGFGTFFATAQKVLPGRTLFLFDRCICEMTMNEEATSAGGYPRSQLAAFMAETVLAAFPDDIRPRVRELTIPTYGQIFGHKEGYDEYYTPDEDEQLPLMAEISNRLACCLWEHEDTVYWYWLQNAVREDISPSLFAHADRQGHPGAGRSSSLRGVRPIFLLADP